jgi:hypothetical protein
MLRTIFKLFFLITLLYIPINDIGLGIITNYFDELICVFLLIYSVIKNKTSNTYIWLILLFIVINLINALLSSMPFDLFRFALDLFLFLKPIIFIMVLSQISPKVFKESFNFFFMTSRLYLILAFIFLPFHYLYDSFKFYDSRFGLNAYNFIAVNAGDFSNMLLVTTLISSAGRSNKWNKFFILIGIILMLSSLRFKSFVIALALVIFLNRRILFVMHNFLREKVLRRKTFNFKNILKLLPLAIIILLPGYGQFVKYFLSEDLTPRLQLFLEGLNIFKENFPFGIGPGYFGSATSSLMYSPVYTELGWADHWGLGENADTNFLNDTFWPMVMAQYGLLGLIIVIVIYRNFFYSYFSTHTFNSFKYTLLSILSLFLSTIGSAIFIGHIGLFYILSKFLIDNSYKTREN